MWESLFDGVSLFVESLDEIVVLIAFAAWVCGSIPLLGRTFDPLDHPIRRAILAKLAERRTWTRTDLAAALESDEQVDEVDRGRIEVGLHHDHLPKLADGQYLDYDRRNGDVVRWKDAKDVQSALRHS